MKRHLFLLPLLAGAILFGSTAPSSAVLANAWHIPDNTVPNNGANMRNPEFEVGTSTTVTIFSGVQKFGNSFGTADQNGGTLFYKGASQGVWLTASLGFVNNTGNDQYWSATLNTSSFGTNEVIQYYLYLTFNSGAENTYVYAPSGLGDHGGNVTNQQSVAATSPFTIRNRPAFLFHSSNRVIGGTTVQFWTKAGYIGKDGTSNWVTNGALYYTTDGTNPAGSLGVAGNANTTVVSLGLDHIEGDPSPAGNATWWIGTASNLPTFTAIRYKIGLWNSSNNEEKSADYRAPSDTYLGHVFSFSLGTVGDPSLTVNGTEANYTTSHLYLDEIAGDSIPLAMSFSPNAQNVDPATVQILTNLNRRDYATLPYTDGNGIATEEGISPPSGDVVGTNDNHYYKGYAMTPNGSNTVFTATLNAQKTGAYRLTARYRLNSSSTWVYYSSNGRRDHALVVAPKGARDINLYEINTLNINASGQQMNQRSTFADLHNNSRRWNLNYLKDLGCNYLWFQPIHPNGIDGRQIDPNTGLPFTVGSPYAVKNFFEVMELMGANNTRSGALNEFQSFMTDADSAGVGVMLDAPFNHTSYDSELAAQGVNLFKPGANPTDQIRNSDARFYSRGDLFNIANNNYCTRASSAATIAPAPDRNDFGKFADTFDAFFGNYSALVCHNDADNGNYLNESDSFDYGNGNWTSTDFTASGVNNNITRNVWRFFAAYIPYWLTQTGHSGVNSTPANGDYATRLALDSKGIDALRADFGQGLPPQCWEYIMNVARSHKWNFVFMTESLDGGAVTYRSARHFEILNENIIFPFKAATQTSDYRNIFDQRRSAYGQGLVLLNNTSHDEENYDDPFQALIRYGVSNTIDGAPMIFYGQENGITRTFGFSHYEVNFGKYIPHFKVFNDLGPIIGNPGSGVQYLSPVYAAMGQARQFSRALRSSNRYYLNQVGGGVQQSIFSVAKYETPNGSPASSDVVFGFMSLDRNNDQQGNFDVNITQNSSNLFGIKTGRNYNIKNVAAYLGAHDYRRNIWQWRVDPANELSASAPKIGSEILNNGIFVGMKKVPTNDAGWTTAPFEAQYLKLYDVTAPSGTAGSPSAPNAYHYGLGTGVTINWLSAPADSEGIVPCYKGSVSINDIPTSTFTTCSTTTTLFAAVGSTITVTIETINPSDPTVTGPSNSPINFKLIDPNGDDDGDGMKNSSEDVAGTNPFDPMSILRVSSVTRPDANNVSITWASVSGKHYFVQSASTPGGMYSDVTTEIVATSPTSSKSIPATTPAFYRVRLAP
jgi:hypothetical protein